MTGFEVLNRALLLLGYTDQNGEPDAAQTAALNKRGVTLVDQLCADLSQVESGTAAGVTSLTQPLPLSDAAARGVLPYGVAMLLAAARGDGDQQQLFSALYTAKRRGLRPAERVEDRLPRGWEE